MQKESPSVLLLLPWFILVWIGVFLWQGAEHIRDEHRHKESLVDVGESSIGVLEAAIQSMGRGRRQRPDFLGLVLEELISVSKVKGAWVAENDGTLIASTGVVPEMKVYPGAVWLENGLVVGRSIDLGRHAAGHRGWGVFSEEEPLPAHLQLFLDRAGVDHEIAADLLLRVTIVAVVSLALTGGFLVLRSGRRARRLREDLVIAQDRAQRNREWALLGAGMAHETKTPLSVVRGVAERLIDECDHFPRQKEDVGRIVEEVDRVVSRINEFLQFSRPVDPVMKPLELQLLLEEMANLVDADLSSRQGRLVIDVDTITILADRRMLLQILLNLLVNAARAISEGGEIRLSGKRTGENHAVIDIRDNGCGIPASEVEKVFEPYYTRSSGGTGLGLAIVSRLAQAHGWKVEISSKENVGTCVRLSGILRSKDEGKQKNHPRRR